MKCFDERDTNVSVISNSPFISALGNAAAFIVRTEQPSRVSGVKDRHLFSATGSYKPSVSATPIGMDANKPVWTTVEQAMELHDEKRG